MSNETAAAVADEAHDDEHAHPSDILFVKIAIILAVITAVEVAWAYLPWGDTFGAHVFEYGGLMIMMFGKFVLVAQYFMHLKWDKPILGGLFYGGLVLAVIVYLIALATFEFLTGGSVSYV